MLEMFLFYQAGLLGHMLIPKEGTVPLVASVMNKNGRIEYFSKRLLDCVRKKNDSRYTEQQVLKIHFIYSLSPLKSMLCFTLQPLAVPAFSKFVECMSAFIERNQKISSKTLPFPQVQHYLNEFEFFLLSLSLCPCSSIT